MDQSLSKHPEMHAVSFDSGLRVTPAIKMVIALLTKSINDNIAITKKDILSVYMDWRDAQKYSPTKYEKRKCIGLNRVTNKWIYEWEEVSRDEYMNQRHIQMSARTWFKSNLAGAIIRGKLLVIPVIDIE